MAMDGSSFCIVGHYWSLSPVLLCVTHCGRSFSHTGIAAKACSDGETEAQSEKDCLTGTSIPSHRQVCLSHRHLPLEPAWARVGESQGRGLLETRGQDLSMPGE
jgi:hypothetical protein